LTSEKTPTIDAADDINSHVIYTSPLSIKGRAGVFIEADAVESAVVVPRQSPTGLRNPPFIVGSSISGYKSHIHGNPKKAGSMIGAK